MTKQNTLFRITEAEPYCSFQFKVPISLEMNKDEQWIVYGPNGSGKTCLVDTLRGAYRLKHGSVAYDFSPSTSTRVSDNIHCVTFHDQYSDNGEPTFYQLRWNQGLLSDKEPTVGDVINQLIQESGADKELLSALNIDDLKSKKIIMLSSGEFRRFQIARIVFRRPRLLIIDNPFIGLDERNRILVSNFLDTLIRNLPIQIMLIVSRMVPDLNLFTHVVTVRNGEINKMTRQEFLKSDSCGSQVSLRGVSDIQKEMDQVLEPSFSGEQPAEVLSMRNVTIRYGERTILKDLHWEVHEGEKWALEGENGAGKSTLLSLVCADNPQAYACDITLFGRQRGSGESIWEIKRYIGYMSPEMYRTYRKVAPVKNIIASGLYDSVGLFRHFTEEDYSKIDFWLRLFGIEHLKEQNYMNLSGGEQRLVLLVRAFVKDPRLLILDEPFHGLDDANRAKCRQIIEAFCERKGKTLIMVSHYQEDFPSCISHHIKLQKHS
ncbi:MAG: ATP-binding cassette domain-containing protein [Bacteroidaceae bacterium]|nr:ATP-binding cassette domain-containing protein [Bacteroidaceae bacterium]